MKKPKQPQELTAKQHERLHLIARDFPSYQATIRKAYSGVSKAVAVKAKCLDCTNLQRNEITNCQAEACPLWRVRPYQIKEGSSPLPAGTDNQPEAEDDSEEDEKD